MKRLDIESELLELGAPAGRQGYIQMVTALEFIMQHDDVMCAAANLYPYVAERLNTVPPRVERNIREEIYAIWSRGNQDRLNELFVNREKCPLVTSRTTMGSNNLANQEGYIYLTSVSLPVWESMI